MFDVNDPSNKDRVAMLQSGVEIVRDHPLTGVGPDMVKSVYKEYRQPWAVNDLNVHLHNVPVHIAAERGLPALLIWIGFILYLARDLIRRVTHEPPAVARRRRARRGRGHARRRAVRVQLRGLRVPDALPGADHPALRVGPHRRRRRRAMTADAPSLAALRSLVARIADRPIVVVGDVMLDQFTIGRVQRISPEAPVPVVEHIGDEVRLGGAANVAHNIRALGATPRLIGLVGADDAAATLRAALGTRRHRRRRPDRGPRAGRPRARSAS